MSDIEGAMEVVEEFIDTGVKTMYLMDAWMDICDYIKECEKEKKNERTNNKRVYKRRSNKSV